MGGFKIIQVEPGQEHRIHAPKKSKTVAVAKGFGPVVEVVSEHKFDSSKGVKDKYTVRVYANDTASCNCQGWGVQKKEKDGTSIPRECTHTRRMEGKLRKKLGAWK